MNTRRKSRGCALQITYFDDAYDYMQINFGDKTALIAKNGWRVQRTDTIFFDSDEGEYSVSGYRSNDPVKNLIAVKKILLDESDSDLAPNGKKQVLFHSSEAELLRRMGLVDLTNRLDEPMNIKEISDCVYAITGKEIVISAATAGAVLKAVGLKPRGADYKEHWFDAECAKMQSFGLYENEIENENQILFGDDVAALCYMLLFEKDKDEPNLIRLAEEAGAEKFLDTFERNVVFCYYNYREPLIYEMERKSEEAGIDVSTLYLRGANLSHTYYNELTTSDCRYYILCGCFDRHIKRVGRGLLLVYDRKNGKARFIKRRFTRPYAMLATRGGTMFYIIESEVYRYNPETCESTLIWQQPEGYALQEVPTITNDGRYMSLFWGERVHHQPDNAGVLDTQTGELCHFLDTKWVSKHFDGKVNPFAGHIIINPEDRTLVQFLHGGGDNQDDRMWMCNTKTGEKWEPYKQVYTKNGEFGEELTHWFWSWDGKRIYFVRIAPCALNTPSGITYVDIEHPERGAVTINGDYPYIHVGIAPDNHTFAADTHIVMGNGKYVSEIYLYDDEKKCARIIDRVPITCSHPGHPHPSFSADGSQIIFAQSDDSCSLISVSIIETQKARKVLEKEKTESAARFICADKDGSQGMVLRLADPERTGSKCVKESRHCVRIEPGAAAHFTVDSAYIKPTQNELKITVTYYADKETKAALVYNSALKTEDYKEKNEKEKDFILKGGEWKTETLHFTDASLRSAMFDFNSDIKIKADSTFYISSVVIEGE